MVRSLPLFLLGICLAAPTMGKSLQTTCETGYVDWEDRSLSEVVESSHTIFLANAVEFVADPVQEGFDGYYVMSSTGTELKGGPQGQIKVYGLAPFPYPPQNYIEIRERHQEIADRHRAYGQSSPPGGITRVTRIGSHCPVAPRMVIGYRYLVMLGTDSRLSFQPIHTAHQDAFYLLVRELVEAERR